MYEESAISIFRKLPETKQQVSKYHSLVRDSVLSGEIDPLLFATQVSAFEQLLKRLKEDILIKDTILAEAEKYGKSFKKYTATFQVKEAGVTYDFSECQDFDYEQLSEKIAELAEKKKERETFLKALKPDMVVFGQDGRQLEPPVKKSSTIVAVTLNDE